MHPARLVLFSVVSSLALTCQLFSQHGRPAHTYPADVSVAWFELLYDRVKADGLSPPVAARRYGLAGIALYEAIVPGTGLASLGGQLNGLAAFEAPAPGAQFHWPTVANAALARAFELMFSTSPNSVAAFTALRDQLAGPLGHGVNAATTARSVARGQAIANAVSAWAATDGFATYNNCAFTPPQGPEFWIPTPPMFQMNPLRPCWGQLRTCAVSSGTACAPPPPPAFSTVAGSEFHNQALEVYETVNAQIPEQQTIARFWADGRVATGTPPGHWIALTSQLLAEDSASLELAARAYVRVGVAVNDAFICCWNTKYQYNLLRPVSYIQAHINADWTSFIGTPAFPEYTSGHSTQSGAVAVVLTDIFGVRSFTDNTHTVHNPGLNLAPRTFSSFDEAALEAAQSRLYGGIHYRAANENGLAQGTCIGQTILANLNF